MRVTGPSGPVRVGEPAARTLVTEFARRNDPKAGLLVGATPTSPRCWPRRSRRCSPATRSTVVPTPATAPADLREHVTAQGRWVADRVRVVDSLAEADPAEVVIAAEPFTGTVEQARAASTG